MKTKPTIGIFGLTGCAGDQLVILNCEDELLEIFERVDVKDFAMAMSGNDHHCPLDVALVEGSVVTPDDEQMLKEIRTRARPSSSWALVSASRSSDFCSASSRLFTLRARPTRRSATGLSSGGTSRKAPMGSIAFGYRPMW